MSHCGVCELELPSKDEALILIWQMDEINALLESVGADKLQKDTWYWTKTQYRDSSAWCWSQECYCFGIAKYYPQAVVPFFAI